MSEKWRKCQKLFKSQFKEEEALPFEADICPGKKPTSIEQHDFF